MQWSDIPRNPTPRTLRQFAGLWIVFFGGLAIWQYAVNGRVGLASALGVLAFTVGPVGWLFPRVLKPVFVTWLMLAFPIGWLVSRIVLLLLFGAVMTPAAAVSRLAGRDVLKLKRTRDVTSYWTVKERPTDIASYFRQF